MGGELLHRFQQFLIMEGLLQDAAVGKARGQLLVRRGGEIEYGQARREIEKRFRLVGNHKVGYDLSFTQEINRMGHPASGDFVAASLQYRPQKSAYKRILGD